MGKYLLADGHNETARWAISAARLLCQTLTTGLFTRSISGLLSLWTTSP